MYNYDLRKIQTVDSLVIKVTGVMAEFEVTGFVRAFVYVIVIAGFILLSSVNIVLSIIMMEILQTSSFYYVINLSCDVFV